MTILATHFALVLGAWRLRVRIDIDEPREDDLAAVPAGPREYAASADHPARVSARGRG